MAEETVAVPALAAELDALHAALDRFWRGLDVALTQPPDLEWRLAFTTALAEIATNIMRHAYPGGTPSGRMELRLRAYPDRVVASLSDQGIAFREPPARQAADNLDALTVLEGGYGLAIARAYLDDLDYSRSPGGVNCWRLVKRFTPPDGP